MANKRGPDFGEVAPKNDDGRIDTTGSLSPFGGASTTTLTSANYGQNAEIARVTPYNSFRLGQQILFWITIYNRLVNPPGWWITQVKLKPWWLRPNLEFRGAGDGGWKTIDEQTFSGGTDVNNRRCWVPSQKVVSVTQFAPGPMPPAAEASHVDSYYMDDVWTFDLQDPADADYADIPLGAQQGLWRQVGFLYVAHGYSLGFTVDTTTAGQSGPVAPDVYLDLNWVTGTLG